MKADKRRRLEAAGWQVGTAAELLDLSPADQAFVELKLRLARALREVRTRAEMTQQQVARRLGSSQSRVAKMEAGDPSVSLDLLARSLLAIGSSLRELGGVIAGTRAPGPTLKKKARPSGRRAAKKTTAKATAKARAKRAKRVAKKPATPVRR